MRLGRVDGREIEIPVDGGALAGLDYGGAPEGAPVLFVHGSGHNAAAWADVAERLAARCRMIAVDLRGHGQTPLDSATPTAAAGQTASEWYWRDLAAAVRWLGWERPVLVGHSTGGYAVTAVAAEGLVTPAAICVIDGFVLDDRATAIERHAPWRTPEAAAALRERFGYGVVAASDSEMLDHVERYVREAPDDPLTIGARPEAVRALARRSFLRWGAGWIRRPTPAEIAVVSAIDPDRPVFPAVDIYDRVRCPLAAVLAATGFYIDRRDEVVAIVEAREGRVLFELATGHNAPMTCPDGVADVIGATLRAAGG